MLSFDEIMKQAAMQQQRAKDEISYLKVKQQETEAQKKLKLVQMHKSNPDKPEKPTKNNNKEPPSLSDVFKNFKIPKKIDPDAPKKVENSPRPSTSKSINSHVSSKPSNKNSVVPATAPLKKSSIHDRNVNPDTKTTKNAAFTPNIEKKLKNKDETDERRQKMRKDIPKKNESLKPSSTPAVSRFDNDLLNLLNEAKHVSKAPPPKPPPPKPTFSKPPVAIVAPKKVDTSKGSSDKKDKNPAMLKGKKPLDVTIGKKRFSNNFTEQPPKKKPATFEEMMKLANENAKKLQSGEPLVPPTSQAGPSKPKNNSLPDSRSKPDHRKSSTMDFKKSSDMVSKSHSSRLSNSGRPFPSVNSNPKKKELAIIPRKNDIPVQKTSSNFKNYDQKHQFNQKKPYQMEFKKNIESRSVPSLSKPMGKPSTLPSSSSSLRKEYPPNRYHHNPYMTQHRYDEYDDEDASSLDDFIDDDGVDDRPVTSELNKVLRQFCRSGKETWKRREQEINLSTMQADYRTVEAEDRRSSRIARMEDMLEEQKGARRLQ